ncbi:hypothetical protein CMI37_21065 [Candidatus Pacearchaeota archaeon]|nr:hypothetical protein [Candidatus Pacearchaeota archaeon]
MRSRVDIDALSITDGKISNQAKIKPSKLAPGAEAQVMIAQANGKYAPKTISGDGTLEANGRLTVTQTVAPAVEETLEVDSIQVGPPIEGGENRQFKISKTGGPNTVAVRDSTGSLNAERLGGKTVSQIITANQPGAEITTTVTDGTQTEQVLPNKVIRYIESAAGYVSDPAPKKEFTVTHDLGFEPQVTVLADTTVNKNGADTDFSEIDCEVSSTSTSTTIKLTEYGQRLKIICGG